MGASKYIQKTFQKEWKGTEGDYNYRSIKQKREIEFRKEKRAVVKIDKPTNLASARQIGYKAKQGIFVVRVRIRKGSGTYSRPKSKRRPKRQGQAKLTKNKGIRAIAEERASKKFSNAEVIGSYKIGEDGTNHYYEIVLADANASAIKNDKELKFLKDQKGRAERGKTFSGGVNKETNQKNKRKKKKKKLAQHNHSK